MRTALSAIVLCSSLLVPPAALAGGSAPLLSLAAADAFAASNGAVTLVVQGSFNFGDVVEGVFPAGLVVWSGSTFVRLDQAGHALAGSAPFLADGLSGTDVPALLQAGTPAAAPARLAQLRAERITVVLPADFPAGPAHVALFAAYDGGNFASNTLDVIVP